MITTLDRAISLANDLKVAIAVLECFNKRLPESIVDKTGFNYKDSYYNIRHHLLGFNDLLTAARDELIVLAVREKFEKQAHNLLETWRNISLEKQDEKISGPINESILETVNKNITEGVNENIPK